MYLNRRVFVMRSGRPSTSITHENFETVHLVLDNRCIKVYKLEKTILISYGFTESIPSDHLHLSKVCERWMPKLLTAEIKRSRFTNHYSLLTE